jgi:hypothetical protein
MIAAPQAFTLAGRQPWLRTSPWFPLLMPAAHSRAAPGKVDAADRSPLMNRSASPGSFRGN